MQIEIGFTVYSKKIDLFLKAWFTMYFHFLFFAFDIFIDPINLHEEKVGNLK